MSWEPSPFCHIVKLNYLLPNVIFTINQLSAWRRKDPIERGSGSFILGQCAFWSDSLSDEKLKMQTNKVFSVSSFLNLLL